jgi:hypothetical protein
MLCGALSEMAKRVGINNGRYVKELENLSRSVHSLPAGGPAMAALGGGMGAAMVSICVALVGLCSARRLMWFVKGLGCLWRWSVTACAS